jgi:hypothetical protein
VESVTKATSSFPVWDLHCYSIQNETFISNKKPTNMVSLVLNYESNWRLLTFRNTGLGGGGNRDRENILKIVIKEALPRQKSTANPIIHHLLYGLEVVT